MLDYELERLTDGWKISFNFDFNNKCWSNKQIFHSEDEVQNFLEKLEKDRFLNDLTQLDCIQTIKQLFINLYNIYIDHKLTEQEKNTFFNNLENEIYFKGISDQNIQTIIYFIDKNQYIFQ